MMSRQGPPDGGLDRPLFAIDLPVLAVLGAGRLTKIWRSRCLLPRLWRDRSHARASGRG
jgi:hypothetical protein